MKNQDYTLTIEKLLETSNLSEEDKKRFKEYTFYLTNYEETKNLGKAYGYLRKQNEQLKIEIRQLKREIEEMKNVY